LRLQRRMQVEQVFGELGKFLRGVLARMLDDPFAHLEGEIEPGKIQVTLLELFDDPQGVQVVIEETAVVVHQLVQFALARMAEWRVTDVMNQSERFHEFRIEAKGRGDSASDLRDFECMSEAIAKVIGETRGEDLGFRFEAAKSARVNDAVAVPSKGA